MIDRVGSRWVAAASLLLVGVGFGSLGFLTDRLWHLYGTFALLGAAGVGSSPVAYGRSVASWFSNRRGMALAVVVTGGALGGVVHPVIVTALIDRLGWRSACVALGLLVILIGPPIVLRFVRDRPEAIPAAAARGPRSRRKELASGSLWLLIAILFVATMVQNSVIVHLVVLLTDRGITPGRAAVAMSAMAAAAVLGRLATGWWIDRVFAARVAVLSMLLAAAGASLLSTAETFWLGTVAAMLVGFGTGGESDVVPYLLSRYFGLGSLSALYGLAWTANAIGGALGPVLMGRAFDRAGSYQPMLVALAAAALIAAVLAALLPRYGATPRADISAT